MYLTIFIQLVNVGPSAGPTFDLYSDADGYVVPFATGVTVTTLQNGYWFSNVPLGTTLIKITSVGDCTNSIILEIEGLPGCNEAYCEEYCCNYELSNTSGGLRSWSYFDCEGTEVLGIYDTGDSLRFCADKSIGEIFVDEGCTLTLLSCCYECYCYTLIGELSFTVQYMDCLGNTQTQISSFNGFQHVVSYCGGAPTLIAGTYNETYIFGNCFWDYIDYICPP